MLSTQHNDSAVDLRGDGEDGAWNTMVHGSGSGVADMDEDEFITIHDSIHGHITIHPLLKAIIDTPEFDRLVWLYWNEGLHSMSSFLGFEVSGN